MGSRSSVWHSVQGREEAVCVDRGDQNRGTMLGVEMLQACLMIGQDIGTRVNITFLGSHHGPAALRFDTPHGGHRVRHPVPHAITVAYLVKPVARGVLADLHRVKQNVGSGVAGDLCV